MDIKAKIEELRHLMYMWQNWETIVQEKRREAVWGKGHALDDIKVQTAPKIDRMEDVILDVAELDKRYQEIFDRAWKCKDEMDRIIEEHAEPGDITTLCLYSFGANLEEMPRIRDEKNPMREVEKAIKRLQANIDREEEIARQPKGVRCLIRGEKRKCKKCEGGFVSFVKEEKDRFLFKCDTCGHRTKADKLLQKTTD